MKKLIAKIGAATLACTLTVGVFVADGENGNINASTSIITNGSKSSQLNATGSWMKSDGVFEYYVDGESSPAIVLSAQDLTTLGTDINSLADAIKETNVNTAESITKTTNSIMASIGAKEYDVTSVYKKGDYVAKDGVLYVISADGKATDANMTKTTLEEVINTIIENNTTVSDMNGWKFNYNASSKTLKLTHSN